MEQEHGKIIKRNIRDSVFTHLFADTEYVLELYKALHPEDVDVTEDCIQLVTLENVISNGIYNDLGFMINDKMVVLAEAQSTWSVNIIIRAMMYLAETYQKYIDDKGINIYGSKKADIPKPELYVIYTGETKVNKEYIRLSEEFFDGDSPFFDINVKVLLNGEPGDIINQYITFCKIYSDKLKEYKDPQKAIGETIKICKDKNILKKYLELREREVYDIMFSLFDQDKIYELTLRDAKREGREEGREEGIINTLAGLVKKSILTIAQAAQEAGMSVSEFEKKAGISN